MSSPPSVCATRGCLLPFCWLPRSCTPHTHTPHAFCFPGQEQPEPPSSGSRSIPPALHRNPEPKHGAVLAPAPRRQRLRACPHPAAGHRTQQGAGGVGGGEMRAATALHPHGQIPKAAVVQAQGAITTPSTPAASPFWGRGGDGGPARPPQDTHTHIPAVLPFGVAAAGEFQLFRHLYLFWLPLLLRPRYKLKAASLPAPSEPHLFTSSLPGQAEGGLLRALKGCHRAPPISPRAEGCQQRLLAAGACHR